MTTYVPPQTAENVVKERQTLKKEVEKKRMCWRRRPRLKVADSVSRLQAYFWLKGCVSRLVCKNGKQTRIVDTCGTNMLLPAKISCLRASLKFRKGEFLLKIQKKGVPR